MVWEEIELRPSNTAPKGVQVVARQDLPFALCIPYGGIYRNANETNAIERHVNDKGFRRNSHDAVYEGIDSNGNKELGMADAPSKIRISIRSVARWIL